MISTKASAVLRRRWPILVISLMMGVVAGAASVQLAPSDIVQKYRAEQVIASNPNASVPGRVQQDSLKVTRGEIPIVAAESLGDDTRPDELAKKIDVKVDTDSFSFTISSAAANPDRAAERVNAMADAFLSVTNGQLLKTEEVRAKQLEEAADSADAQLARFDDSYPEVLNPPDPPIDPETGEPIELDPSQTAATAALLEQRQNLAFAAAEAQSAVAVQDAQLAELRPYSSLGEQTPTLAARSALEVPSNIAVRAPLLGVLGLLLGVILALILERLNRRIDTRRELADACSLPILAEVGFVPEGRRPEADGAIQLAGVWAEPYRRLRSALLFVQQIARPGSNDSGVAVDGALQREEKRRGTVFMFTSTAPREGKTTSAVLVAQALAETGVRTLLVGADYRRPTIEGVMGAEQGATIADLTGPAENRATLDQVVRPTQFPNLFLALSGQPTRDVNDVLAATRELTAQATAQHATVIIDTSPLNAASDPLDLLPVVDHVIMVVRSGNSTVSDLSDSVETLERLGADIIGVVLVGTPNAGRRQAYYYDYYSAEGTPEPHPGSIAQPGDQDASQEARDSGVGGADDGESSHPSDDELSPSPAT